MFNHIHCKICGKKTVLHNDCISKRLKDVCEDCAGDLYEEFIREGLEKFLEKKLKQN